jgi:hypothetical protein
MVYTKIKKADKYIYTFDSSFGKDNYSQRNNLFKWVHPKNDKLTMDALSECNVTSIVMALDYAGWIFPKDSKYSQPEDALCNFIFNNPQVLNFYKTKMPAMYEAFERGDTDAYTPNLVHEVLAFGANTWLGCTKAVEFSATRSISSIFNRIIGNNIPVVMSGTFPYTNAAGKKTTIGHINVLVGLEYELEIDSPTESDFDFNKVKPVSLLADDPYGDLHANFSATSNRNNIRIPYDEFITYYKPLNDNSIKFGHFIAPPAALI